MEKTCNNCLHSDGDCTELPPCTIENGRAEWKPEQPAREQQDELVTVPLNLPADLRRKVDDLAAQCGLTSEQMASAMIVLAFRNTEVVEEPPKPATISINGVEVPAPITVGYTNDYGNGCFVMLEYCDNKTAIDVKTVISDAMRGRKS